MTGLFEYANFDIFNNSMSRVGVHSRNFFIFTESGAYLKWNELKTYCKFEINLNGTRMRRGALVLKILKPKGLWSEKASSMKSCTVWCSSFFTSRVKTKFTCPRRRLPTRVFKSLGSLCPDFTKLSGQNTSKITEFKFNLWR